MDRKCKYCDKNISEFADIDAEFCSTKCRKEHAKENKPTKKRHGATVQCLICGKYFKVVSTHVVRVHGYKSVKDYKQEFGLKQKELRSEAYARKMRNKMTPERIEFAKELGRKYGNFEIEGEHGKRITEFWENRRKREAEENNG